MKKLCFVLAGSALASAGVLAQAVIERGPHHSIVQSIERAYVDGEAVEIPHQFVEIGSGLNYWSPQQNAWLPSTDVIELLNNGAVYRQGQYKLIFASNINDPNGNLEWFPAEDNRIVIQTIGLAVTEEATGDSIWIGQLRDAEGFLSAHNEVTWPSCFAGIDASVKVTVRPFGFENDVTIHERPVNPGFEGPTRLEVWHEIISGPEPGIRHASAQRGGKADIDVWLQFGSMVIAPGTAFLIGEDQRPISASPGSRIQVAKEYFNDPETGKRFLIESVPGAAAEAHLQTLPPSTGAFKLDKQARERLVAARKDGKARRKPMAFQAPPKSSSERMVASISRRNGAGKPGFLVDFTTLVTQTNMTLAGNVTYCVSSNSAVNLDGTTVFEPNCVIKFGQNDAGNTLPVINILGAVDFQSKPYAPVVFTSREDRSAGETNTALAASVNTSAAYGAYHLYFVSTNASAVSLHDVRTLYSHNAFGFASTNAVDAWNVQAYGTKNNVFESSGLTNRFRNILAHNVNNVVVPSANNAKFSGEHFTIHSASKSFYDNGKTGCSFGLVNGLLIVVTNASSSGFTTVASATNSSDAGVFQTVGAGAHYLADGSLYRNAGTNAISTNLSQGVFRYSTTYPPLVITNTFASDTVLSPQAIRDTDTPDLGWHYPAIDWAVGNLSVSTGVTLTLTNGVSIAGYDVNALTLNGTSKLLSEGTPLNLNRIVRYNTVQEQPVEWGSVGATMRLINISAASQVSVRLTEASHLAYTPSSTRVNFIGVSGSSLPATFTIRDCQIYSSAVGVSHSSGSTATADVINNLFHRSVVSFFGSSSVTMNASANNNLHRYGTLNFSRQGSGAWNANNNLFDNCTAAISYNSVTNSDNGYNSGATTMSGAVNSITITTFDYQIGALGRWYYPTNGGNLSTLIDNGSQTVGSAGLAHHTVRLDHAKDTSTVDVGFHYVAIDANGPIDTDGDGVPDYLEDRNGDGSAAGDATDWQAYNSPNSLSGTSDLRVYTPLK